MKTCPDCNGDGVVEKGTDDERRCPTCGGSGFVPDDDESHEEIIKTSPICRVLRESKDFRSHLSISRQNSLGTAICLLSFGEK